VWTRYGDSVGLGEDWPRALAHEIGHYALFLDDNYIGRDDTPERTLISIPPEADGAECRGAMSNPYRDDYSELQPRGSVKDPYAWDTYCAKTLSNYETKRADWETIKAFYDSTGQGFSLRQPTTYNQYAGPSAQVLSFTSVKLPATANASQLISAPIYSLERADGSRYSYTPGSRVQAFRYTNGDSQIIDLGRPRADLLNARGATIGDRICVYDQSGTVWASGCTTVAATSSPIRIALTERWQPQITITPIDTAHVRVEIAADGIVTTGAAAPTLRVTLFADAPASGTISADLSLAPDARVYSYTFTTSEAIYNGHLRVQVNGDTAAAGRREIVSEYKVSGSLPVATSLQVGTKTCTCDAPVAATSDGQMLAYGDALGTDEFYSFQSASAVAAAPAWGIFVGQVYNFYTNIPASQIQSKHLYLTAAYLESELPAGTEGGLAIYYSADGTGWKRLPQSRFDPSRNEISSAVVGPGYYALVSRIEVEAGWNLISYPWAEPLDVLAATARLNIVGGTNFTTIHSYEPQDRANPWKVYDVDVPGWVNDLTQLGYSRGYWFIVPLGGGTPTQYATQSLAVGVPVPPAIYYGVLPYHGSGASVGLDVQVLSGNTVCSTSKTFTPIGTKQVAFLIEVLPAGQGAPAGCGINGEPVMIIVGGKLIGQATWDNSRPITFRDTYLPLIFGPPAAPLASAPDAGNPSDTTTTNGATNERWSGQQVP
jgi:hypothetical protein